MSRARATRKLTGCNASKSEHGRSISKNTRSKRKQIAARAIHWGDTGRNTHPWPSAAVGYIYGRSPAAPCR